MSEPGKTAEEQPVEKSEIDPQVLEEMVPWSESETLARRGAAERRRQEARRAKVEWAVFVVVVLMAGVVLRWRWGR